ncbi:MAG TPA: EboA domain-containing protein [Azospirillum sp.]|nr:EboA domain-containing protein [Azospirillum sp.]
MSDPDTPLICALLDVWLGRQLTSAARGWLEEAKGRVAAGPDRDVFLVIGLAGRKVGKGELSLTPEDLEDARRARPGWDPRSLTLDQAARIRLLLADDDAGRFAVRLDRLSVAAEVGELVAFLRGLPLYPAPERHLARAAKGVRSNMMDVFRAVAHANPYPAERFPQDAWNQMVLKALFIGVPLHPIQGLERRANPALARMLCDYARERRAARRPVSPELWRCVGPHADGAALADLEQALAGPDPAERGGAALALAASPHPGASAALARAPELRDAAADGRLAWERLA